jgi:hypothetical protein
MSNTLAIAAVTATLRNLLVNAFNADPDLAGTVVATMPPDKASATNNTSQVNLFLYHTAPNAAWRNTDMPTQVKPGESGYPPLALNLYYMLTAYRQDNDDVISHRLLGRAMSALYDHPVLGAAEIKAALPGNDLADQIERVRITPQQLSLEEMSKLWTTFQTQYRITVAYQVSVVLIESQRPTKTPLPVLTRGKDDSGIVSQPDLTPPFPTISDLTLPNNQPSAQLGDALTLVGFHLDGDTVTARFHHPRLTAPIDVPVMAGGTASQVSVQLPNAPANWPAGVYSVSLVVGHAGQPDRVTNEWPFALAPKITSALPINVTRDGSGTATVALTCSPEVRPDQRASLLVSDREILAQPHPAQTASLTFAITNALVGEFYIRLRVDGVDSLLIKYQAQPPVFDPSQKVKIA